MLGDLQREIDYRIQGLPYSTVQQEVHTRKEAVKKVDSSIRNASKSRGVERPTWDTITRTTQSAKSRRTWPEALETWKHFELCKKSRKIQYPHCLTYWTKGIVYCICGTCLRRTDKKRKLKRDRFDALSIPNHVINKGPSHGARHGNTERQRNFHAAHTAAQKAKKKEYASVLARFQNCPTYRESQLATG